MCSSTCVDFGARQLLSEEVCGKLVLEVGSRIVQLPEMTLRPLVTALGPQGYVGVDIHPGLGVDEVCSASELRSRFGEESFDVVVATEVVEHIKEWRLALSNMKHVLRPGGILLLTTRSRGFKYHGYPSDHWRYEIDDIRYILGDLDIIALEADPAPHAPGVFVKARKPASFEERDLSGYPLYSIIRRKTVRNPPTRLYEFAFLAGLRTYRAVVPARARQSINKYVLRHQV